jgi:hypothetical protein
MFILTVRSDKQIQSFCFETGCRGELDIKALVDSTRCKDAQQQTNMTQIVQGLDNNYVAMQEL